MAGIADAGLGSGEDSIAGAGGGSKPPFIGGIGAADVIGCGGEGGCG